MASSVQCPNCNQRISLAIEQFGQTVTCPMCKSAFIVDPPEVDAGQAATSQSPADRFRNISEETVVSQHPESKSDLWILGALGCGCLVAIVVLAAVAAYVFTK